MAPDLTVFLGQLQLANPVLTASGTFGYAREFEGLVDVNRLGGVVTKGISLAPRVGNRPPRIVETPCGMLNAIGLENVGVDRFLKEKMPYLSGLTTAVVVNILGDTLEEYRELARRLDGVEGVDAIEVNISCPNVKAGGVAFGVDPVMAARVTEVVRSATRLPVIVKLSPNVTDITVIARAVEAAGADALSLVNTFIGMAIDTERRKPKLGNVIGGLSGPAIRPIAVRLVWQVTRAVKIPVIGMGGIAAVEDALEFLIAGASAIQVGTANFIEPDIAVRIVDGLVAYMRRHGFARLPDLVGSLALPG